MNYTIAIECGNCDVCCRQLSVCDVCSLCKDDASQFYGHRRSNALEMQDGTFNNNCVISLIWRCALRTFWTPVASWTTTKGDMLLIWLWWKGRRPYEQNFHFLFENLNRGNCIRLYIGQTLLFSGLFLTAKSQSFASPLTVCMYDITVNWRPFATEFT
jgi:hypothetical protein